MTLVDSPLDLDPRLDPVRRPRLPRGGTLFRAVLATALLCLAAVLLYAEPNAGPGGPLPGPCPPAPPPLASDRLPVPHGLVGLPVALADPAALAVLRAGDRVDLFGAPAQAVASAALVLAAVGADPAPALYLALTETEAERVLALDPNIRFRVIVRPQGS